MTQPISSPQPDGLRGTHANIASRGAAVTVDCVAIVVLYYAGIGIGMLVWALVNLERPQFLRWDEWTWAVTFMAWLFLYAWLSWSVAGKTLGKLLFGLRIVTPTGERIGWVRALRRIGGWIVCVLSLGIGFAWIAVSPTRRGWHDYIAGTCVVYDWDAHVGSMFVPSPHGVARLVPRRASTPSQPS
jgi:uncharacterized RDD family membrane protein YckC